MLSYKVKLNNLLVTQKLAKLITLSIVTNFVIGLNGELGVGKTTLIKNILQALGVTGSIKSPTYTIVEPYQVGEMVIYHFDLYRFIDADEWLASGLNEYFINPSFCFIEWAQKAEGLIPRLDWQINLTFDQAIRWVEINAISNKGEECLRKLIGSAENSLA